MIKEYHRMITESTIIIAYPLIGHHALKAWAKKSGIYIMIVFIIRRKMNTILIQYGSESVLIQRILISFAIKLEIFFIS